ncbi:hypothetical protein B4135_0877 [Caldibacillus debilis]|uniref:Uncharacterized protein n=1 Tax=Caldibacillus debilis TaxID=301148 RepID=A0A150M615_9BACI|nr:hypothetical protein B4135_0877 [Caldibacillus debilis]
MISGRLFPAPLLFGGFRFESGMKPFSDGPTGGFRRTGSRNRHPSDGKKGGGFEAKPDADVRRMKKRFQNGQKRARTLASAAAGRPATGNGNRKL